MSEIQQIDCPYCGQAVALALGERTHRQENTVVCTGCGRSFQASMAPPLARMTLPVQDYQSPRMDRAPKTALIAIIALLLGVLGFAIPILATAGAIVCGIIGIRKTGLGKEKGRGLAVAALCLAGVQVLMVPPMIIALQRARETARSVACMSNLRQIAVACFMYSAENKGDFPDHVDKLFPYGTTGRIFICPDTSDTASAATTQQKFAADIAAGGHDSYVYVGAGLKVSPHSENLVLLYEPLANHHDAASNMAFADGHCERIDRIWAQRIIKQLQAGQNPPPAYGASSSATGGP